MINRTALCGVCRAIGQGSAGVGGRKQSFTSATCGYGGATGQDRSLAAAACRVSPCTDDFPESSCGTGSRRKANT